MDRLPDPVKWVEVGVVDLVAEEVPLQDSAVVVGPSPVTEVHRLVAVVAQGVDIWREDLATAVEGGAQEIKEVG